MKQHVNIAVGSGMTSKNRTKTAISIISHCTQTALIAEDERHILLSISASIKVCDCIIEAFFFFLAFNHVCLLGGWA